MLTADDRVKILDFGLAKALENPAEHDPHGVGVSHSPTMTLGATAAGVILGTAAYMAPEQAKGRAADKRSDVLPREGSQSSHSRRVSRSVPD